MNTTIQPLADKIRPAEFKDIFGQEKALQQILSMLKVQLRSIILWGPPGSGKTTIAKIIAQETKFNSFLISAVINNTIEIKQIFKLAVDKKALGESTILLVDEIHRFNKAQQDLFLPYLEDGTIVVIGTTTENPSFELNRALLSRCTVIVIKRLNADSMSQILARVENMMQKKLPFTEDVKNILYEFADGDGRYLLNMCEMLLNIKSEQMLSLPEVVNILQKRAPQYDKSCDEHYNLISALHKAIRGSDVDASLYWLSRMLNSGEDPSYLLRRLVRIALEDVGLADPRALEQALAAKNAYEVLGSPEGELALAQAVIYLATAPKSNAGYVAYTKASQDAQNTGSFMPPKHILNAPTKFMSEQAYGKGYIYDHDTVHGFSGQNYFPETMSRKKYYYPLARGFERDLLARIQYWQKLREKVK